MLEVPSRPPVRPVDVRVLGIEYNQGYQDVIYTDLRSPSAVGDVPQANLPGRPTSRLSLPVVPGKPMVVRVFLTLGRDPAPPAGGVEVTGRLNVWNGLTGHLGHDVRPLNSRACRDHLGRGPESGQGCSQVVKIFPSLGRAGLAGVGDHDLDLIEARSHWGSTLNFLIPGDVTAEAGRSGTIVLSAAVHPVHDRETRNANNRFRLELPNVARLNPLRLRVVPVAVRHGRTVLAAPSPANTRRALRDLGRMLLPYSSVEAVPDSTYTTVASSVASFRDGGCRFNSAGRPAVGDHQHQS